MAEGAIAAVRGGCGPAFVGCGGHAFRNVYPALRYAPVDLVAVCDYDLERAKVYAREFGAAHAYASPYGHAGA